MAGRFLILNTLALALLAGLCCTGQAAAAPDSAPSFDRSARIGDLVFVKGVTISNITLPKAKGGNIDPSINGGELSDYSFDPAKLPAGLKFNRFTRTLSGTPATVMPQEIHHLWVHDDDENWTVKDAASLRFSIKVVSRSAAGLKDNPRPAHSRPPEPYPTEFSASFESEAQWFDRDRPPKFSRTTTWQQTVWRGERTHKQILIAGDAARGHWSISASDLENQRGYRIPASRVTFRYPKFVIGDPEARDCGGYPERHQVSLLADALAAKPERDLPRFYPGMVWVWVDIPAEAEPGEYKGTINIESSSGDRAELAVRFRVTAWRMPRVSKREFHLDLWQFPVSILDRFHHANPAASVALWSDAHYALLEPFYRYLAALGQRTVTTYIKEDAMGAPSMVRWSALNNGKTWRFDYSAFDRHVERMAAWGIDRQINAFSVVGWNKDEIPFWDAASKQHKIFEAPVGSKAYNALWNNFLTDFKRHLRNKGWFEKTVLYMDEVPQAQMNAVIGLIRANDRAWKIGLAYGHAPHPRVIHSLYDVSGYYEAEVAVRTYDHQLTTFYTSCALKRPNNYVAANADPADMTALPWYAKMRGHDGYLRWAFDNWKAFKPFDLRDGQFTAGDFSFVYRSSNKLDMTLVPSVRSELLRDGIEDFEKLTLLGNMLTSCDNQADLRELRTAIQSFSTKALMEGRAEQLLTDGRALLDALSLKINPVDCSG